MKGRLIGDMVRGRNGKWRITLELDSDFREGYDALHDQELEIGIAKWRPFRSKQANAYFHVLVNQIATVRGLSDDEVKKDLVTRYGAVSVKDGFKVGFKLPKNVDPDDIYPYTRWFKEEEENGRKYDCYIVYKRTSLMDSKEMAHLIDGAIQEAQELGIDCDTPEQKARYAT